VAAQDDFVCAQCTEWAGLGVVDVLAGTLDLPEVDRATLRMWHERHCSFSRVLTREEENGEVKTITVRNIVNDRPYTIRMNVGTGCEVWGTGDSVRSVIVVARLRCAMKRRR
jgi:hypothetical protein